MPAKGRPEALSPQTFTPVLPRMPTNIELKAKIPTTTQLL